MKKGKKTEEKELFLKYVYEVIKDNPEFLGETISVINYGISKRLEEEMEKSTSVEIGFMASLSHTKPDKDLILKALKSLRYCRGTKWQEEKIKQFSK